MADLTIKIGASSKEFQAELDKVSQSTDELQGHFQATAKAATIAFGAVAAAIGLVVNEYAEAEKIALQTNAVIKATGGVAGVSSGQVKNLAESFQKVTAFSDEAIQQSENLLLNFTKIGSEVFPEATQATLDLATRMGTDATSAAQTLGKALESPTEGLNQLRRQGIFFTDSQKQLIQQFEATNQIAKAQKIILDQVNASVGGLAQESAKGVSGGFAQLKNVISDISEKLGEQFAPSILAGIEKLKELLVFVKENETAMKVLAGALAAAFIGTGIVAALATITTAITALGPIATAAGAALGALATGPIAPIIAAAAALGVIVSAGKDLYDLSNRRSSGRDEGLQDARRADDAVLSEQTRAEKAKAFQEKRRREEEQLNQKRLEDERNNLNQSLLEFQGYSEEYLELLKQYRENERALETEHDAIKRETRLALREEIGAELTQQYESDMAGKEEFEQQIALMEEQYNLEKFDRQSKLYQDLQREAQKNYQSQEKMQQTFIKQQMAEDRKSKQQRYEDEKKYGETYAALNQFMHTQVYTGTRQAFGELENLTRSKNETLRSIGKAAAIANIIMSTAQSAMLVYQGFATIPIIGQALGIAGAAAAIAFGAEQLGTVTGLAEGGIAVGGIRGIDSIPAMLSPGELVVPTQNFDEVINAVSAQRNAENGVSTEFVQGQNQNVTVQIEFVGDASQLLTAKQIEDRSLGLSRET